MALHYALKTFALAHAHYVDEFFVFEQINQNSIPRLVITLLW